MKHESELWYRTWLDCVLISLNMRKMKNESFVSCRRLFSSCETLHWPKWNRISFTNCSVSFHLKSDMWRKERLSLCAGFVYLRNYLIYINLLASEWKASTVVITNSSVYSLSPLSDLSFSHGNRLRTLSIKLFSWFFLGVFRWEIIWDLHWRRGKIST